MAMLKPKHVFPLYKSARAVFVSGASQSNTWQSPLDQSQSATSVCDESRTDPPPQLQDLHSRAPPLPSSQAVAFDRKISPPRPSTSAMLGSATLSRPPPYIPVPEQLFKQGTVIPTARGSAFLPEFARQLHSGSEGAKQVVESLLPGREGMASLHGSIISGAAGRNAVKEFVSSSAGSSPADPSSRFRISQTRQASAVRVQLGNVEKWGQSAPATPIPNIPSVPNVSNLPNVSTSNVSAAISSASAPLPPYTVVPSSSSLNLSGLPSTSSTIVSVSKDGIASSLVDSPPALKEDASINVQTSDVKSASLGSSVSTSTSSAELIAGSNAFSRLGQEHALPANSTTSKSNLSADAPAWTPPTAGPVLSAQNGHANLIQGTQFCEDDSSKGVLGPEPAILSLDSGTLQSKGRCTTRQSPKSKPIVSASMGVARRRSKERTIDCETGSGSASLSSKMLFNSAGHIEQNEENSTGGMGGAAARIYSGRNGKRGKPQAIQSHPFHAKRMPSHAMVVRDICQILKRDLQTRAFVPSSSEGILEHNDLFSALEEWKGIITAYHVCDVLKQVTDPNVAMAFFNWACEQPHFRADVYVYTTMIGVMGRAKNLDAVGQLLEEMKEKGCQPNVVTYNRAMHAYGRANMMKEALELKKQMEEEGLFPDSVTHSTLIDIFSKAGMHGRVVEIYEDLKATGFTADNVVLTMLMNSYGRLGYWMKAMNIFEELSTNGNVPGMISWNTIIDIFGKAGKPNMALKAFHDMINAGLKPDVLTYSTIIDICGKCGQYSQAEELFEKMVEEGHIPDNIAWNTLVQMWGKAGHPKRAASWFRKMLQAGIHPTVPSFNTLIHSFLRGGLFDEARLVFNLMQKRGFQPSLNTYTLLLTECTTSSDAYVVNMLVDLLQLSGHPVHGMLKALLQEPGGDEEMLWEEVNGYWEKIQCEESEARRAFSDSVISFLTKYGFHARAGRVWEEARQRSVWPNARLDQVQSNPRMWHLDLHAMSSSTAVVAVCTELNALRSQALHPGTNPFPKVLQIITGRGNRSRVKGLSMLKSEVLDFLSLMKSPFGEDSMNPGKLRAPGEAARDWLLSEETGHRLRLQDGV